MEPSDAMGVRVGRSTGAIVDEAADWVVRIGAPDVGLDERREFVAWLKRSPLHIGEYLRLECTWAELGGADARRRVDIEALLASEHDNVVELECARESAAAPDQERPSAVGPRRARLRTMGVALAATAAVALIGLAWFQLVAADNYSTGIGEQRSLKLDDGSTVVLNTGTRVRVAFTEARREIRLLEGEALFSVAKDASRPFRVVSDRAVAQAIGTSFIVRRKALQTVVTVIEGEVAVTHSPRAGDAGFPEPVHVSAGARADIADRGISTSRIENPAAAAAWRSGRLVFEGETLAEAVAEFNRYNQVQIVLKDSSLSSERLSGVFDADQPQSLVRFLERSGVVQPAQRSGSDIILVPQR